MLPSGTKCPVASIIRLKFTAIGWAAQPTVLSRLNTTCLETGVGGTNGVGGTIGVGGTMLTTCTLPLKFTLAQNPPI